MGPTVVGAAVGSWLGAGLCGVGVGSADGCGVAPFKLSKNYHPLAVELWLNTVVGLLEVAIGARAAAVGDGGALASRTLAIMSVLCDLSHVPRTALSVSPARAVARRPRRLFRRTDAPATRGAKLCATQRAIADRSSYLYVLAHAATIGQRWGGAVRSNGGTKRAVQALTASLSHDMRAVRVDAWLSDCHGLCLLSQLLK